MSEPGYGNGIGAKDLVRGNVELASPPDVYVRVTAVLDDPAHTAQDLASVIDKDPSLTTRLLKVVNSAFYGLRSQISTVSRAVTIVGAGELRDLVLATAVVEYFNGLPNHIVSMRSFWHQSLRCAALARALAAQHERAGSLESIFVGGLLHRIGHLIMYRKLPELSREALMRHRFSDAALEVCEREVFGFDYAQVGGELMRMWELPEALQETVGLHTRPERASRFLTETALVSLAARLAPLETLNEAAVHARVPAPDPIWKRAGVSDTRVADALARAEENYAAALALFAT